MTSMLWLPLLVLLQQAPAAGGSCEAQYASSVDQRGDQAMGFSHEQTAHHFTLTADGGRISAAALSADDVASRDAIRAHMGHIAQAFTAGNFEMPMFIHGQTPPGVPTMKRLRDRIAYRSEDTELGARVVILTRDPDAIAAVHAFLKFQIADHRTGDPTSVQK
jgi:hypothetical protein